MRYFISPGGYVRRTGATYLYRTCSGGAWSEPPRYPCNRLLHDVGSTKQILLKQDPELQIIQESYSSAADAPTEASGMRWTEDVAAEHMWGGEPTCDLPAHSSICREDPTPPQSISISPSYPSLIIIIMNKSIFNYLFPTYYLIFRKLIICPNLLNFKLGRFSNGCRWKF